MASISFEGVSKVFPDGTTAVDRLDLEIGDGELAVLVGPSGSGKSTALRMVAGLEGATEGTVRIGDRVVNDLPPRQRDIAMVFQSYALYPHMSADDNIGFALKVRRAPRPERRDRVTQAARRLGIDRLLRRRPFQLSGGQRQRVALGRAIVRSPQAFLMDEPLSNLDAKLRVEMRSYLVELQRELRTTTLYVTHDQTEALTMGDRVAVLRDGRLEQEAPPQEIYDRPANLFVARFIGSPPMNVVWGRLERSGSDVRVQLGDQSLALGPDELARRPELAGHRGQEVLVGIRPEAVELAPGDGPSDTTLELEVALIELLGSDVLVHCHGDGLTAPWPQQFDTPEDLSEPSSGLVGTLPSDGSRPRARLAARLPAGTRVAVGDRLRLRIDRHRLHLFEPVTTAAIGTTDASAAPRPVAVTHR